jgi:hypothetical protein
MYGAGAHTWTSKLFAIHTFEGLGCALAALKLCEHELYVGASI